MPLDPNTPLPQEAPPSSVRYSPSLGKSLVTLFSGTSARMGYLAALDQGVISLTNFLATIILARNVNPTELGVYGVGFITLRLARSFQEGITVQPMNVFGAAMDETTFKRYATSSSVIQLIWAMISSLVVAVAGWGLTELGNDTAGPALFSLWFAFLFWQLQEYVRRMLYTRQAVMHAVFNTVVANSIRLAILLWWATQGKLSGAAGLDAIAWGALLSLLPGLWSTRNYWTKNMFGLKETWVRNWGFGRWVFGGTIANWVAVEFYPILTAGMVSFAAAGAYRALQNLVAPVHLLLRATDTFITPRAARLFQKNGQRALTRMLRLTYLVSVIPIMGLLAIAVLFPQPLLRLLYGDTYIAYSKGILLMVAFYALWYAYWPLQSAFKAVRLSRPIFTANLAATCTMFTIGIWAIYHWGVYGTIGGQVLSALVVNIVLWKAWSAVKPKG